MPIATPDPLTLLRPRRKIAGMSAVLLPFLETGRIDWDGFCAHVARTRDAGLVPAVNMDTGFVALLTDEERRTVLRHTQAIMAGQPFIAGAYLADREGDTFDLPGYLAVIETIHEHGGVPILFPSFGLTRQEPAAIVDAYSEIARRCPRFLAFELGEMFLPAGRIFDLKTFADILAIRECVGIKHSSLRRELEWQRLRLRDELRPGFQILTGNDLAIDMVMYGSDYLLGLSTFAPDLFARRDALWLAGDPAFYELNDLLQYLGCLAFRSPVPGYRHNAAQFLKLRGWLASDRTHPHSPARPDSDVALLRDILERLSMREPTVGQAF